VKWLKEISPNLAARNNGPSSKLFPKHNIPILEKIDSAPLIFAFLPHATYLPVVLEDNARTLVGELSSVCCVFILTSN
jgi:hypothetical protein